MIKIIFYNTSLLKGGTDTYMFELIKNIDKSKFSVDVLIKDGNNIDEFMYNSLKELGSNVYLATGSFASRILWLRKFFKKHKNTYQVAHINATSQGTGLISYFAKHNGKVKKVIFHSHMGGNDNGKSFIDKIGAKLMLKYSDVFAACSKTASAFMFESKVKNNDVVILNNSVDTNKFKFDATTRKKLRSSFNLKDNDFAILHVGRFAKQKNHRHLILIFNELLKTEPTAKLFLIGDGILLNEIKEQVKSLQIDQSVVFLGLKNNVYEYMNMADCFVMPSFHEGLPIVAVEAQSADLPCVLSENISTETKLIDKVKFISLDAPLDDWCKSIKSFKNQERHSNKELFKTLGFDKSSTAKIIEEIYKK